MGNLISVTFFLSILASLSQPAFASHISILGSLPSDSNSNNLLLLSGEIQKGDAEKLAKAFMQAHPFAGKLTLDSPGGDVEEALRIVSLVKPLHLVIEVAGGGTCASACFFIFLAGDHHYAIGTIGGKMIKRSLGYIGLHRPYLKLDPTKKDGSTDAVTRQHDLMQKTSAYLRNQDIPQRLIDLMMSRPSNDIYWMTMDDIDELGSNSPGLEELLISRCGDSIRKITDGLTSAMLSHDSAAVAREEARAKAFGICSATAFPDLTDETLTTTERLRKGWRPWSISKVAGKRQ